MKVLIIGAGTMGTGIAQCFAGSGMDTYLYDIQANAVERATASLERTIQRLVEKNRLSVEDQEHFFQHYHPITSISECGEVDLVLEAVVEKMEVKKHLWSSLANEALGTPIFATNTSSLSVTELASVLPNPQNMVGLHFFNPAPLMKLVEVVQATKSSEETIQKVLSIVNALGKQPILVQESPGFVVNRILIPMINEAIGVLAEGVAKAQDVDAAMQLGANHPMGPLALADLIGLDVVLDIMDVLQQETGDSKYRAHIYLKKMVRAGKLGRKSGEGFYTYSK